MTLEDSMTKYRDQLSMVFEKFKDPEHKIAKQTSIQKRLGIKPPKTVNGLRYKWDFLSGKYRKVETPSPISKWFRKNRKY